MFIGLDVHGVIDKYPEIFSVFSREAADRGHKIFIITGQPKEEVLPELTKYKIIYDHIFSIVDYHKQIIGTKMWLGPKGTWYCDDVVWNRTKGDYIAEMHIDIHFDDTVDYANWIPDTCTFILVPKTNFQAFMEVVAGKIFR